MRKIKEKMILLGFISILSAVAVISGFCNPQFVMAQEETYDQEKESTKKSRGTVELDKTTVTAQKQEENIQDVPMSISVLNSHDIEDKNIESVHEIADFIPNLMLFRDGPANFNSPSMRGIHAPAESFTVSTGLFIDGIPVLSATGFEEDIVDIERIEVLRGPQGTLYGKNTEAGVINIITKQPDNEFRARMSAQGGMMLSSEAGNKAKYAPSLSLSGPILKDKIFLGVSGQYYRKDGYVENTLTGDTIDDREHWFGRGNLRWTPNDDLDISLIYSRLEYDEGAASMNLGDLGVFMFGLSNPDDRKVSSNFEGFNDSTCDAQSLKITYDLTESLKLTSITTRRDYNDSAGADYDYSPMNLMHIIRDNEYTKVSQELRMGYNFGSLKGLIGFYYENDDKDIEYETLSDMPGMGSVTDRQLDGDTYAVFANFTYSLTQKLSVIAGLRYESEEVDFEDFVADIETDESWDAITPKIALEYSFSPAFMTYCSVSQGFRSGGFNFAATDPQYYSYDDESLWSYEIGAKSAFLNNRLILNGSIYYMDIEDMQVSEAISPMESYTTNAAEATAYGAELEMTARFTEAFNIMAGIGYSDVEFDTFKDALGDYEGNTNPFAPKYTFNLGAQYRHETGIYARADLIGYSKIYLDKANDYSRSSYEIVNAKLGYETEHFDFYLYGKNIFDTEYNSYGYGNGYYTVYSDPGEIGLQVVYRF